MQTAETFLNWDTCGPEYYWMIDEGRDYPRLWWENALGEPIRHGATLTEFLTGTGTQDDPYLVHTADELNLIRQFPCDYGKHFRLMADIDLSGYTYDEAVIAPATWMRVHTPFTGVFNGNGHSVSHLTMMGGDNLGLFGVLDDNAQVRNLRVLEADINGSKSVGILAGMNSGSITRCIGGGEVVGHNMVGGLVGSNHGSIVASKSTGTTSGEDWDAGGLVGYNGGDIRSSYSDSQVSGNNCVGGLTGNNDLSRFGNTITDCYSTGAVAGDILVGGLVGSNWQSTISNSYSTGLVTGNEYVGGLVGSTNEGDIIDSLWDMNTSGLSESDGGTGLSTAEMQTASTFLEAGWDFVGETENGTDDIWWILEGQDYPRLWWEPPQEELLKE
jgi:hypothetical protein